MIDLGCMIKSLWLAWLKRIFGKNDGAWKLKLSTCFIAAFQMSLNINDIKDDILSLLCSIPNNLLQWWSDFQDSFDTGKEWQFILWNNKEIRINNRPIFYEKFFENAGYHLYKGSFVRQRYYKFVQDCFKQNQQIIFSFGKDFRHSVLSHLKTDICAPSEISLSLTIENIDYDVLQKNLRITTH